MLGLRILCLIVAWPLLAAGQATHTICEVQEYDAQGLSPLLGESVVIRGAVTVPPGYLSPQYTLFYVEENACGVAAFMSGSLALGLALGDSVYVAGTVEEYISGSTGAGATTEIYFDDDSDVQIISTGNAELEPADMDLASIQTEANEGRLLRTVGRVVHTNYDWLIQLGDGADTLYIYRGGNDSVSFGPFDIGDTLRVTGVLSQYDQSPPYLDGYELVPRFQRDIELWDDNPVHSCSWGRIKTLYRDSWAGHLTSVWSRRPPRRPGLR